MKSTAPENQPTTQHQTLSEYVSQSRLMFRSLSFVCFLYLYISLMVFTRGNPHSLCVEPPASVLKFD